MASAMPINGRSRYHNVQLSWNCWFPTKSANDDAAWIYAPRPPAMSTIRINRCSKDAKKLMRSQSRLTGYFFGDFASSPVLACAARTSWAMSDPTDLPSGAFAATPLGSFALSLASESVAGPMAAATCVSLALGGGGHGAGQRLKNK